MVMIVTKLQLRKATPLDAEKVVPLVIDAIGDIAKRMTGESEPEMIEQSMCELSKLNDNPHAYRVTYIAELDGEIAGTMILYSGKEAPRLDRNLSAWLEEKGAEITHIDAESLPDELYINTISVNPKFRGNGIGTQLLHYAETVAKQQGIGKIALNVETGKEKAIRLYERVGYEIVSPWTIIGEPFHHMVKVI